MKNSRVITVQDIPITISKGEMDDYICITDMAAFKSDDIRAADVVKNWLRNRATLEFLGTWEQIYNPNFKVVEFDHFKSEAGLHTFVISVSEWVEKTNAVKKYILPEKKYKENLEWLAYAEEADVLNVALFGFTAKAWREANTELAKRNNVRDFASINELTVLSNLETHNADMIREGKSKEERFLKLKEIAEYQLTILNEAEKVRMLPDKEALGENK